MAYRQHTWIDGSAPALSALNLNEMEEGLAVSVASTNYSTTEQVIGTWIDGKPLYRKVIAVETSTVTHNANTTINVPLSSLPVGKIVRFDCLLTGNNTVNQEVNKYIVPERYDRTNDRLTLYCEATYSTNSIHVILEYTKSTD